MSTVHSNGTCNVHFASGTKEKRVPRDRMRVLGPRLRQVDETDRNQERAPEAKSAAMQQGSKQEVSGIMMMLEKWQESEGAASERYKKAVEARNAAREAKRALEEKEPSSGSIEGKIGRTKSYSKAATEVQRMLRGYRVRVKIKRDSSLADMNQTRAAIEIQRIYRGHLGRCVLSWLKSIGANPVPARADEGRAQRSSTIDAEVAVRNINNFHWRGEHRGIAHHVLGKLHER